MSETLHQYLKESTRKRHEQAEGHPFQGTLAQGRLPLPSYKLYLAQLLQLHAAFEQKLSEAQRQDPLVESVVRPEHFQLSYLQSDLSALGVTSTSEAAPCIKTFANLEMFRRTPASLLGVLYVLLGSKHGGKFIARNVREAYKLSDGGWTYFDPFGDKFKDIWQQFTAGLNSLPEDELLRKDVLAAADATFEVFVEMGDVIWKQDAELAKPAS